MSNARFGLRVRNGLVRGITEGLTQTLFLDSFPFAAVAFSLRKLRLSYNGFAIRVRRSSDNAEQDIGFNSIDLDITSLLTFVGSNNGFVTIWYDQSGNNNHAVQNTAANQPRIVNAGVIEIINTKPALFFDGLNDGFNLTNSITGNQPKSEFIVQRMISNVSFMGLCGPSSGGANTIYGPTMFPIFGAFFMRWQQGYLQLNSENVTTQTLMTGIGLSSSGLYYRNNVLRPTSFISVPLTSNYTQLGYGSTYSNAYAQECIHYSLDQTTNASNIQTAINSYYAIH